MEQLDCWNFPRELYQVPQLHRFEEKKQKSSQIKTEITLRQIVTILDLELPSSLMTYVRMNTSAGDIDIQLYTEECPETTGNFLKLVDNEFYNGLHFHRVIKDFMIQGGCPYSRDPHNGRAGTGGPGWKIQCEVAALKKRHDKPGIFSMANAGRDTGGSQFFLTTVETPWLDGNHAVFGEVAKGMDVVRKIETTSTSHGDRPETPQKIIKVERI